jgi:hypothetical protein
VTPSDEVSTPSAVCREEPTLVSATGDEVVAPCAIPHVGVAVPASSTSASPTTCGSDNLVREGNDGATDTSCGPAADLHRTNYTSKILFKRVKIASALSPYLGATRSRAFGQNTRGFIAAGIFAHVVAALRYASKPC